MTTYHKLNREIASGTELSFADVQKIAQERYLFIEEWREVTVASYE